MEELLHHLGCTKPCKSWDKLPTWTGAGFLPTTVPPDRALMRSLATASWFTWLGNCFMCLNPERGKGGHWNLQWKISIFFGRKMFAIKKQQRFRSSKKNVEDDMMICLLSKIDVDTMGWCFVGVLLKFYDSSTWVCTHQSDLNCSWKIADCLM